MKFSVLLIMREVRKEHERTEKITKFNPTTRMSWPALLSGHHCKESPVNSVWCRMIILHVELPGMKTLAKPVHWALVTQPSTDLSLVTKDLLCCKCNSDLTIIISNQSWGFVYGAFCHRDDHQLSYRENIHAFRDRQTSDTRHQTARPNVSVNFTEIIGKWDWI